MARVRLAVCGRCGKPRGLLHECTGRRRGKAWQWKPALSFTCRTCGERVPNLLTHECTVKTDFRKRKAAAERKAKTEARRRKRNAATARRRAARRARRREAAEQRKRAAQQQREKRRKAAQPQSHDRQRHDYQTCTDPYCSRHPCRVFREGRETGQVEGHAEGYGKGYADGMSACPLPHQ